MKIKNIFLAIATLSTFSFSYADQPCDDLISGYGRIWGSCSTPIGSNGSSRNDSNVYMGLVWNIENFASKNPDILIGLRTTKINFKNNVKGADLNIRLQPTKNYTIEGIRLSYLDGSRNSIVNLGGGYSFNKSDSLITAAVETAHIRLGSDYLLSGKILSPFAEVNTLKRIKRVTSNLSCAREVETLRRVDNNSSFTYATDEYRNNLLPGLTTLGPLQPQANPFIPAGSMTCFEQVD